MKQSYQSRYNAYSRALEYLSQNESITSAVPAFATVYGKIKTLLDAVAELDNVRKQNRQAVAAGKYQYQADLGQQALTISGAIVTYAVSINDEELKRSMKFTRSQLFYSTDPDLGSRVSNILQKAKELGDKLKDYGITAEMIAGFEKLTAQYLPEANSTSTHLAKRVNATQLINDKLNEARELMDNQLDMLMIQFEISHPAFYNQYIILRTVPTTAHRKTRVEGIVSEKMTEGGLANVLVRLKGSEVVTTTAADGSYTLKTPPLVGAQIEYVREGYATVTVQLLIKRGQAVKQDVAMEKAA